MLDGLVAFHCGNTSLILHINHTRSSVGQVFFAQTSQKSPFNSVRGVTQDSQTIALNRVETTGKSVEEIRLIAEYLRQGTSASICCLFIPKSRSTMVKPKLCCLHRGSPRFAETNDAMTDAVRHSMVTGYGVSRYLSTAYWDRRSDLQIAGIIVQTSWTSYVVGVQSHLLRESFDVLSSMRPGLRRVAGIVVWRSICFETFVEFHDPYDNIVHCIRYSFRRDEAWSTMRIEKRSERAKGVDVYFDSIILTNSITCLVGGQTATLCVHTLVVDLAVAVDVRFADHLVDLSIRELLA